MYKLNKKLKNRNLPFLHVQIQRQASRKAVWAVEIRKSIEKLGEKSKIKCAAIIIINMGNNNLQKTEPKYSTKSFNKTINEKLQQNYGEIYIYILLYICVCKYSICVLRIKLFSSKKLLVI